jgi:hypothetical protein
LVKLTKDPTVRFGMPTEILANGVVFTYYPVAQPLAFRNLTTGVRVVANFRFVLANRNT